MTWHTGHETINGLSLFYRDWRPPEPTGLPVLALHGSLTQSGSWIALAEMAQTLRMLCPDQRGFGLSEDPGSDTCAEFASDAIALAAKLLPARFVVMAHSFACSIALEVARTSAHAAAAVLVDPVLPMRKPTTPPAPPQIAYADSFATFEDAMRHFRDTEEGAWPGDTLKRFTHDVTLRDSESGPWRLPYTLERLRRLRAFTASPASDFNLFDKAKEVRCPVLIFRGGESKRFPAEAEQPFCEAFASKPTVVVCPTSGHFPANTEIEIVAAALKRFLPAR
ncbi:MAG TPA: alpha/beta hydrolase [Rhizomicrobium sp.]|jgi:pimeloyl-ACP methyl ester carboxylesterase|nr:alpha/beta hydrolase [Rhizomicrobium sp.]